MYAVYDSMLIDISEQFDMLPVEPKLRSESQISSIFSRCITTNEVCETANSEKIRQSNNSEPGTNSRENEIKCSKILESKSKMNLMKITEVKSNNEENKDALIDRYFKDQIDRSMCKQNVKSRTDRKVYQRLYKQKQRESLLFKEMERKHKRFTRGSEEIRIKDRKSTLKSKRAARMSSDFKSKERCAKRAARKSDEIRIKDKISTLKSKRAARMTEDFKSKERYAKKAARESYEIRMKDKMSTFKSMRAARMSVDSKSKERYAKRAARKSDEIRIKDKISTLKSKRAARMTEDFKSKERYAKKSCKRIL